MALPLGLQPREEEPSPGKARPLREWSEESHENLHREAERLGAGGTLGVCAGKVCSPVSKVPPLFQTLETAGYVKSVLVSALSVPPTSPPVSSPSPPKAPPTP